MNGFEKYALKWGGFSAERVKAFEAFEADKTEAPKGVTVEKAKMSSRKVMSVKYLNEAVEGVERFGEAILEDGSIIYFPGEDLVEGSVIYVDEEQTEAVGAADWTLENGDVITTGDDGAVMAIAVADAPADDEGGDGDEDLQSNNLEELLAIMAEFNERLSALEGSGEDLAKENDELLKSKEDLSKKLETIKKDNAKLSRVSAATPNVAKANVTEPKRKKFSSVHERIQFNQNKNNN